VAALNPHAIKMPAIAICSGNQLHQRGKKFAIISGSPVRTNTAANLETNSNRSQDVHTSKPSFYDRNSLGKRKLVGSMSI